ncbi:hypothetical protein ACIQV3_01515 [Streptomyces sp. NPDC099050]|uniref:hypothetical protein n=1 Tax=Streptomyces sp. NPDC099050 TaxID=3366100 RepID=UPI0037FF80C4
MFLTAAMASAAVIAAGIAYSGLGDDARAVSVRAGTEAAAPAAAPARDQEPEPLAAAPANETARGMVYDGLAPAPKGDRCAGVYRTRAGLCTHGPDAPPKGVDITKDIAPAVKASAPAADPARPAADDPAGGAGGGRPQDAPAADADRAADKSAAPAPSASGQSVAAVAAGPAGQTVQCDGDGSTGNRVQVVYVHGPGRDRYSQYVASFRKWAADADLIYSASAQETGGVRHPVQGLSGDGRSHRADRHHGRESYGRRPGRVVAGGEATTRLGPLGSPARSPPRTPLSTLVARFPGPKPNAGS